MKTYLAHFANRDGSMGGGQDIKANSKEEAMRKGECMAKRIGKNLADLTEQDDDES